MSSPAKKKPAPVAVKKPAVVKPVVASTSAYLLEDAPLPARTRAAGSSPYPFAAMEVNGKCFKVAAEEIEAALYSNAEELAKAKAEEMRRVASRLSGAALRFSKRHEGFKFAVRMIPDEGKVGVWRVEAGK